MSKFDTLPDRALELASQVGDNFRHLVPSAGKWLETGAKLGVLKTGARAAGMVIRRHPAIAVATVAGAGLLWFAARRRAKRAENGQGDTIEGSARRVEAKRSNSNRSTARKRPSTTARSRTSSTETRDTTH